MRVLSCFFECDILKMGKANVRKRNCYDYSGGSTEAHKVCTKAHKVCTKAHKLPMNYLQITYELPIVSLFKQNKT